MTAIDDMAGKVKQALAEAPAETQGDVDETLERIAAGVERIGDLLAKFLEPPPKVALEDCERCGGEGTLAGTIPCSECGGAGKLKIEQAE